VQKEHIGIGARLAAFYRAKCPGSALSTRQGEGAVVQDLDSVEAGCWWLAGGDGQQGT
jgi:hypothetical protein